MNKFYVRFGGLEVKLETNEIELAMQEAVDVVKRLAGIHPDYAAYIIPATGDIVNPEVEVGKIAALVMVVMPANHPLRYLLKDSTNAKEDIQRALDSGEILNVPFFFKWDK